MNLTDLGAELHARAGELSAQTAAASRLAGIRTRVRARRRRQVAAAAAIVGVCVAVVGLSPALLDLRVDRSEPPATSPLKVKTPDPFVFDDLLAGDPLIASGVGAPGQSDLVVRFTPRDTNLSLSQFCRVSGSASGGPESELWARSTLNGHQTPGASCGADSRANSVSADFADTPQARRAALAEYGVIPGKESVLRIRLETYKGAPRSDPSVRLGVALYELSGPRVVSDGVTIPQLAEAAGHDYRLAAYRTARITGTTRRLALDVSSKATRAGWASAGNPGGGSTEAEERVSVLVDGVEQSENSSGGTAGLELAKGTRTIELRVGAHSTGTMMIAYYEPVTP
jgi:hypothetical protein